MNRNRWFFLTPVLALLLGAGPMEAGQFPGVASVSNSCPVEQGTKLKELDPVRNEVFFQNPGMDQRLIGIVNRFPVAPGEFGAKKPKGKAQFDYFCFNGAVQQGRGRDKEKFDSGGHAAGAQRIPAGANCIFSGVNTSFIGSQKQPAGIDIEVLMGAQAVVPGADPDCFDADTLCLTNDNRFKVSVEWRDFSGGSGSAVGFPRSDESGTFFFFNPDNTEMLLKVLDGCNFNDHFWVFAAATTNVEYTLRVTDTQSNQSRTYTNPLGQPAPAITDTQAFATCP